MTNQEFLNELRECNHSSMWYWMVRKRSDLLIKSKKTWKLRKLNMIKNDLKVEINIIKEVCKKYLEIKEILMDTLRSASVMIFIFLLVILINYGRFKLWKLNN
ncbi:hypothetical protein [Spiroplasma endosymbiont of Nebria brevicollis]|uniref:hypothetical protein n=1 Tax=Spiroplasma endosymbiont of Nebria brevicollis TaxID=3066284 RepID=UPI00313C40C6